MRLFRPTQMARRYEAWILGLVLAIVTSTQSNAQSPNAFLSSTQIPSKQTGIPAQQDRLPPEAHTLSSESARMRRAGKYDEALSLAARALEAAERALGPDHSYVGYLLNELGFLQRERGEYAKAEASYQRALAIYEKALGPDHPQTVDSINGLGLVYVSTDEFGKAGRLLQQALEITERTLGAEHSRVVACLVYLGRLRIKLGDLAQAERDLQRALAISEKALEPDDLLTAKVLNNLANLYVNRKDYERAEPLAQKSLAIKEKSLVPDHPDIAYPLLNLGWIARQQKDYSRALEMYQRALVIHQRALGPEHIDVAALLNNIANVYKSKRDYVKPLELYQRVLKIAEKAGGPYHGLTLVALGNIANLHLARGDVANAITFQRRVDERLEMILALRLAIGSERQKLAHFGSLAERTDRTVSLHVKQAPNDQIAGELAALVLLQRKGRVLDAMAESLTALRQRSNPEDQKLLDQLKAATAELATLALDGPNKMSADEYQTKLSSLEQEKERLEGEISRRSAEFRAQSHPVTLEAVRTAIPPGAALIEFAVYRPFDPKAEINSETYGEPRYVAYVLRRQGEVQWTDLGAVQVIDADITRLRQALRDPARRDVRQLAQALDARIMKPVRALLGDASQLLVSPDGALNLIPFAALVDERGSYLVERYSLTYLTSGRDLLRMQVARDSKGPAVVLADPAFGEPQVIAARAGGDGASKAQLDHSQVFFGPLPGVGAEVRALKELLPRATFLTRAHATKAALKHVRAPRILHIATHGFFLQNDPRVADRVTQTKDTRQLSKLVTKLENPLLRSGLALAGANQSASGDDNGVLTAFEMAHLNLWGTKLVVLSACDTGIGEVKNGEGVYGMRRALVLAGTESQMVSLWPVSDSRTRDLMIGYYQLLLQNQGRGEALRQVQLKMLSSKAHSHPYYWASFIQTGEWANLKGER
jgi:CHAT domain-containing protein/Tfp pilus assembly protein PilF